MIEFSVMGRVRLSGGEDDQLAGLLAQPKRIMLLAYLTLARPRGFQSRDTILALFWPEVDGRHARWALNQAIRYLRRTLGRRAVVSRGQNEVGIDSEHVGCDACDFETACEAGHWAEAVAMYVGELLPGLIPDGAPELGQWLDAERSRLRHLAAHSAAARSEELLAAGDLVGASAFARRSVGLTPDDEARVRRLIELLNAAGDRAGAVLAYQEYAGWLRDTLELQPAPETQQLIQVIQSGRGRLPTPAPPRLVRPTDSVQSAPIVAQPGAPGGGRGQARPSARVRSATVVLGIVTLVAAAILWKLTGADHPVVTSLAVLPCATTAADSLGADRAVEMTEELTATAARSGLFQKVIAPQSARLYRRTTKPPREIGRELGVDAVLYCEYEEAGTIARLRAQLVDDRTSALLWAEELERDMTVPGEPTLAMRAVRALRRYVQFTGDTGPVAENRLPTLDLHALALYTEGRHYLARATESAVRQSISCFDQAIERDSGFALAYLGLSRAYFVLGQAQGSLDAREAFPLMKTAAERALMLDSTLGEADALLAEYEMNFGWDWAAADEYLREALRFNPYDPAVLQARAYFLTLFGRADEAPALDARAIDLSPVDPETWTQAAMHRVLAGRPEEAMPLLRRGQELAPDFPPLLLVAGLLYVEGGRHEQGIAYLRRADSLAGGEVILAGRLGYAEGLAGDLTGARIVLRMLNRTAGAKTPAKTATAIALVHLGLGEMDSAFTWLEAAYRTRSGNLAHALKTPAGWRLARDPRYADLLRRIGLPTDHPSLEEFRQHSRIALAATPIASP
jgi:DNA-binding SARP family transcriptional activator/tetratricopeptide (TPR) repeat protein